MTNNISEVRQLLKLFGESVKRSRVEKLAEERAELCVKLVSHSKDYAPLTTHKTDKIFLLMGKNVVPLVKFDKLSILEDSPKSLNSAVSAQAVKHNITGRSEHKLYRVVRDGHLRMLDIGNVAKEPVSVSRCVFMDKVNEDAYQLKDEQSMEKIKSQFGVTGVVCNIWRFPKGDTSSPKKRLFLLEERTKSTLSLIQQFLSDSPPPTTTTSHKKKGKNEKTRGKDKKNKKDKKEKPKKAKKPKALVEKVPDLIGPLLPIVPQMEIETVVAEMNGLILNRDTSDYNTGLEWFNTCPTLLSELLCI